MFKGNKFGFIKQLTELAINKVGWLQSWPNQFRLRANELSCFLKTYNLPEDARFLEIGCGNAFSSLLLSQLTKRLIATDLFRQDSVSHTVGIKNADLLLRHLGVNNCHLVTCDARKLPFKNSVFDVVFCEYVLEHITHKESVIREMKKVLRKNGVCVAIVPSYIERLFSIPTYYIYLGKRLFYHLIIRGCHRAKQNSLRGKDAIYPAVDIFKRHKHFPLPTPHGSYSGWKEEFLAHLPGSWLNLFKDCGFKVERIFPLMFVPWHLLEAINSHASIWLYERSLCLNNLMNKTAISRYFGYNLCIIAKKT